MNLTDLTQDQLREFKEGFNIFCKDDSGQITAEKLGNMMKSLGFSMTDQEIEDMIAEADTDQKGAIDFPEFLAVFVRKMSDVDPEEEFAEIFAQIDLDNDGKITFSELKLYMQDVGEFDEENGKGDAYVKAIIQEADVDKDGGLDYQEFCYMMLAR